MNLLNIFKGKDLLLRTITYILAVIFFFTTWSILGPGTAFIGATIAKGSLVLLGTDLTGNPIRSTITFLIVFVFIGISSFLSSLNLYIGFFINFFTLFILAYKFSSNIKQLIWRPFVLGFLYLLIEPGDLHSQPARLLTLALGAFFVILTQFIVNKNKSKKLLHSGLKTLIDETSLSIQYILSKENNPPEKSKVTASVNKVISSIYQKRIDPIFITKNDNTILNFTLYIERLNDLLGTIKIDLKNPEEKFFMEDLCNSITNMSRLLINEDSTEELISLLDDFLNRHDNFNTKKYSFYEILQNVEMLKLSIFTSKKFEYKKTEILFSKKLRREINDAWHFNFSRDSLRFTFAIRISTLLSLSYFLVHYFNIEKGSWIMFTIFAVLDPLFEDSKKRFPKRFKGTLWGIFIFLFIFVTIHNIVIEGIIFIFMYYLYVINKDFEIKTMCTATVSLGLFAIVSKDPFTAISYRFFFVILGIIIGYLANKYFLPYNSSRASKRLVNLYYSHSKNLFDFALKNDINKYFFKIFSEKMFLSKLYESKLISFDNSLITDFIHNQRILNNTIFFLFLSIQDNDEDLIAVKNFLKEIGSDNFDFNKLNLQKDFFHLASNEEKLIFANLDRIIFRLDKSKELIDKLSKVDNISQSMSY